MENVVNHDIEDAVNLAELRSRNTGYRSGSGKPIYNFTNELLNHYLSYFENRRRMLSVIGSGDQIFNAILKGVREIEAFDINPLAKYFFYLKKAAFEVLTLEEFFDMFIEGQYCQSDVYQEYYKKIFSVLDSDIRIFWSHLIKCFNGDWHRLYNSHLFMLNSSTYLLSVTNSYFQEEEYLRMRGLLQDSEITLKAGNVLTLADYYSLRRFDLIYLSNVWNYMNLDEYFKAQRKLKLSPNGCLIAYGFSEYKKELFEDEGYKTMTLSNNNVLYIK